MTRKRRFNLISRICIGMFLLLFGQINADATDTRTTVLEKVHRESSLFANRTLLSKVSKENEKTESEESRDAVFPISNADQNDEEIENIRIKLTNEEKTNSPEDSDRPSTLDAVNGKSRFGEIIHESSGKSTSTSTKAMTEEFSRSNGLNTATTKPVQASKEVEITEDYDAINDLRTFGRDREPTTPPNNLSNRAELDEEANPGSREISLINDTNVNYSHFYKTLTESNHRDSSNRSSQFGNGTNSVHESPKEEVEVVENVTHATRMKIILDDKHASSEGQQKKGAGDAAEKKNSPNGTNTNEAYSEPTSPIDEQVSSSDPVVPRGRTIAFSGANDFSNLEAKAGASSAKEVDDDGTVDVPLSTRNTSTERIDRKPYPYAKSTKELSEGRSSEKANRDDKVVEQNTETSAYENTIGRSETEKKFVVTEPSVVIENSIQQFKPIYEKGSRNGTWTNSTTEPQLRLTTVAPLTALGNAKSNGTVDRARSPTDFEAENDVPRGNADDRKEIGAKDGSFDVTGNGITEATATENRESPYGLSYLTERVSNETTKNPSTSRTTESPRTDSGIVPVKVDVQTNVEESLLIRSTLNVTEVSTEYPLSRENSSTYLPSTDNIAGIAPTSRTVLTDVSRESLSSTGTTDVTTPKPDEFPSTTSVEFEFVGLTDFNVQASSEASTDRINAEDSTTGTSVEYAATVINVSSKDTSEDITTVQPTIEAETTTIDDRMITSYEADSPVDYNESRANEVTTATNFDASTNFSDQNVESSTDSLSRTPIDEITDTTIIPVASDSNSLSHHSSVTDIPRVSDASAISSVSNDTDSPRVSTVSTVSPVSNVSDVPHSSSVSNDYSSFGATEIPEISKITNDTRVPSGSNGTLVPAITDVTESPDISHVSNVPMPSNVTGSSRDSTDRASHATNVTDSPSVQVASKEPALSNASDSPRAADVSDGPPISNVTDALRVSSVTDASAILNGTDAPRASDASLSVTDVPTHTASIEDATIASVTDSPAAATSQPFVPSGFVPRTIPTTWSFSSTSTTLAPRGAGVIETLSPDEITLLVRIVIEGTSREVCPHIDKLRRSLADILTDEMDKTVLPTQIVLHQSPCPEAPTPATTPTDISLTSILLYVVDDEGKFDAGMTKILPSLYKASPINFPVTIHSFLLVQEPDSGNAIAVVVVSSVAFICLVLLAGLLFIMRKRQTRFNYGERCRPVSLDAYSLDSVSAYNSVRRKGAARSSKRSYGNPTFEDSSAIPSHPLNFAGLSSFCNDVNAINEEFSGVPQVSVKIDELPPGAEIKNRYANVIPLPETRVPLQKLNNDPLSEYINASYVRGPKNATKYYIACQAPMDTTVTDFWRMIWEQQSKVIIMLTDLVENGVEKCTEYVPPSEVTDCHRLYGDYQVTLKKRETKEKYAISTLHLKNLENNTFREVYHIWYLWPVNGIQSDGAGLIAILLEARALQRGGPGPIVVHCSPGTGRTGTLIALDLGIRQYEITRTVDVPRVVYTIRRDRAGAVQTKEQYAFIYKALNLYATKLAGGVLEST